MGFNFSLHHHWFCAISGLRMFGRGWVYPVRVVRPSCAPHTMAAFWQVTWVLIARMQQLHSDLIVQVLPLKLLILFGRAKF